MSDAQPSAPKWQSDLKSGFKKFKKTMSKENIKQKLSRKPSKEMGKKVLQPTRENVPPPPPSLPQTALKQKTPEPKAHPKSPLAAVQEMKNSESFGTPPRKIDVTKSPSPPLVPKTTAAETLATTLKAKMEAAAPSSSSKDKSSGPKATLLNCTRIAGVAVALFALKTALGSRSGSKSFVSKKI